MSIFNSDINVIRILKVLIQVILDQVGVSKCKNYGDMYEYILL